ncbi:hypothetical protein CSKR_105917 [Clonorchis sinensis]|uniref:Globin X n=2 Tax=Clonorchis sinensis TaxID=79923 RepID=G7Y3I3_CLOSI|nr:hypothetical protein CSKR_105917 [Clonorchis sinensis]GAA47520.1 globin X [Clonorchis sinensis]
MQTNEQCPRSLRKEAILSVDADETDFISVPSIQYPPTPLQPSGDNCSDTDNTQTAQDNVSAQGSRILLCLKRQIRRFFRNDAGSSGLQKNPQDLTLTNATAVERKASPTEKNSGSQFDQKYTSITCGVQEDIESFKNKYNAALLRLDSLTDAQVNGVQSSWMLLKIHIEKIGVIVFLGLFEEHSDFRDAFARFRQKQLSNLTRDPAFQAHGLRVLNVVDKIISRLRRIDTIQDFLFSLGSKHCRYVPNIELVPAVGEQLLEAIRPVLEEQGLWDEDTAVGWEAVLAYLNCAMRYGLVRSLRRS